MPDYKQTDVVGQQWNRFSRIVIDNPRPGAPSVLCVEQEVIALGSGEVIRDIGNLVFPFNPAATFDILDPTTNLPTGQKGDGIQVYALVFSYVMAEAAQRDAAAAAAAAAAEAAANPPVDPASPVPLPMPAP